MQIKKKKQMIGNRACLPEIVYLCDKLRQRRKTPPFFYVRALVNTEIMQSSDAQCNKAE